MDCLDNTNDLTIDFKSKLQTNQTIDLIKLENLSPNKNIHFLNGLCGSGKTFTLLQDIKKTFNSLNSKRLIVVPTKLLSSEYEVNFKKLGIENYYIIDGNHYPYNVKSTFIKMFQLNTHFTSSCEIVITSKLFQMVSNEILGDIAKWDLILDEIPQLDSFFEPCIPYHTSLLTDLLEIDKKITPKLYLMKIKEGMTDKVDEIVSRNVDDVDALIKPLLSQFYFSNVFFDVENWDNLSKAKVTQDSYFFDKKGNPYNKFYAFSILQPDKFLGWRSCTIMGANFEDSLLYQDWSTKNDIDFIESELKKGLRFTKHENGKLVTIYYCFDKLHSKYQGNKLDEFNSGKTYNQMMLDEAIKQLGSDSEVLYFTNNDDKLIYPEKWVRAPLISHGVNTFSNHTKVFFSASLNRCPQHLAMLKSYGVSQEELVKSTLCEVVYQAIMRTSLRNQDNKEQIEIFVADKISAEFIASKFIGCSIGKVGRIQRKVKEVKTKSNTEYKRLSKLEELKRKNELQGQLTEYLKKINVQELYKKDYINENFVKEMYKGNDFHPMIFTKFNNLFDSNTGDCNILSLVELDRIFKSWSINTILNNKDENVLFNLNLYKSIDTRKKENSLLSTAVILDIDSGDLTKEDFTGIFGEKGTNPTSHFFMNSASRKKGDENRLRAVFPVKEAISNENYQLVFNYLINIIKDAGFHSLNLSNKQSQIDYLDDFYGKGKWKKSGIDASKKDLSSIFYAPCTIRGREEYAFYESFAIENRKFKKYGLDIDMIIKYSVIVPEETLLVYEGEQTVKAESNTDRKDSKHYKDILDLISSMQAGNRSYLACQIGGKVKNYSYEIKCQVENMILDAGVDKNAHKQFKKYAGLS